MLWFNKNRQKKMDLLRNYVPTSKAQLIQMSMFFGNGDVEKAQELYDFYARNLDLPDFDPVPPTIMQQMKSFLSWAKENQGDIMQGYQFILSVIKNKGALPEIMTGAAEAPLPPINE